MSLVFFGQQRAKGEILKAERMLVRIERIDNNAAIIPKEYNERTSMKTRLKRPWREYYVVARVGQNDSKHVILHIHKSDRIPATMQTHTQKVARWEILLDPSNTRVSLFSPLDKTIAIVKKKEQKGYIIFIFNCQGLQPSTQWFAFLCEALGQQSRKKMLLVTVPDLDNLQMQVNLYPEGETSIDDQGRALMNGRPISANSLVQRCMNELRKVNKWKDVLDYWEKNYEMGLCWKRYDRIEWIKGGLDSNQDELDTSWSLRDTHSLELRPKMHYPTQVRLGFEKRLSEPAPIEGFLIRLTSASGRNSRFGKRFNKRLYFTSHDNLLFFCSPAKAVPPPPPRMHQTTNHNPENIEGSSGIPLMWANTPYRLQNGMIQWLAEAISPSEVQRYDEKARVEYERCIQLVKDASGCIDLARVKYVRTVKKKTGGQSGGIGQEDRVDAHAAELSRNDSEYAFEEGAASELDDEQTFELVLDNGLVIRLQSYNLETRREWMRRLRDLIKYWKLRHQEDIDSLKEMRAKNLEMIKVDSGHESRYRDWILPYQLVEAASAPGMYHFCRLSSCRTISIRGTLYAKFRRRQTFHIFMIVLTSGTLIIYEHTARSTRGIARPRIHYKKLRSIDLRYCYIYSGLMVDSELMYQTTALDPHLGYRVLPKVYQDGWTSVDDDLSCAFVIWHGQRKFTFRTQKEQAENGGDRHKTVNVGLPGDIAVFMARSRLERDMWMSALGQEISRHASTVRERMTFY